MRTLNQFFSYNKGTLPDGCKLCVKGQKLVLFVTGKCVRKCYFCPLSDNKYGFDVQYANERKISAADDIIVEAQHMDAKGAGITGGDPLLKLERTADYIKKLKQAFGSNFHIHLYTSLHLVTQKSLATLHAAGLDEIRFHPELDNSRFWNHIERAELFDWEVGVEIPIIPNKLRQTMHLVDFINPYVDFLVLNELEIADNSLSKLSSMGFTTISNLSYAVLGSKESGFKVMDYVATHYDFPVHLCTAKLKDKIQLGNRIKREGKHVKKGFDSIDREGLLTRGALYLPVLAPGLAYRKRLEECNKVRLLKELGHIFHIIQSQGIISPNNLFFDSEKLRILLSVNDLKKHRSFFKKLSLLPAIVKEYPTADQLEVEVDFL